MSRSGGQAKTDREHPWAGRAYTTTFSTDNVCNQTQMLMKRTGALKVKVVRNGSASISHGSGHYEEDQASGGGVCAQRLLQ